MNFYPHEFSDICMINYDEILDYISLPTCSPELREGTYSNSFVIWLYECN